ncbi:tetratricopeptide repeat protein [Streptacidiphilus sp. PB12-B1b]|uniref:AfsR/SARP family transcriptional regulator n=1 Tax=Streptacidiphilus sp. PB12-B1b TaxID=2705012 RepID=UPI0015F8B956|nr:BTAD domain-containing putative transcriptional regulator [Streptacidiphilus sp. PB12-B1b]QMU79866.1 tetratricopeptide repeat protein [Streptacidiphilus sp. PB12-B1b]
MLFGLLGPLLVDDGAGERQVSARRQRALLAALLLRANHTVEWDELAACVWDGRPPSGARTTLQGYTLRLRRLLGAAGGRVVTQGSGYRVEVAPDEYDVHRFARLRTEAEQASADADWAACRELLLQGQALWRGTPLQDVPGIAGRGELVWQLTEARLQALELRLQADLELGLHQGAVIELAALAQEHPLRERFAGQLMLALYRSQRQAEALEAYQRTRRTLVKELAVAPGRALQELHQRILCRDPELDLPPTAPHRSAAPPGAPAPAASAPPAPAQLPPLTDDFTGRTAPAGQLLVHLRAPAQDGRSAPRSAAVVGPAGIGKSALALHVAHQLRPDFPDGQLFAAMAGAGPDPVSAHDVQGRFLRALGTPPDAVPAQPEERTALYRTVLAPLRVLIVLDDVGSAAQARELLPGSGASSVLVTARHDLPALTNTRAVDLETLSLDESRALFERIVGADRTRREPEAVAAVLRSCCGLPLAVRIAGARLATRPRWTIGRLADRLADTRRTLSELTAGELSVRAGLALGYAGLHGATAPPASGPGPHPRPDDGDGPSLARCFRLLGLGRLPQFGATAAAALFGIPVDEAEAVLETLVDHRLLELPYGGQYRFHDLTRLYAEETADAEEPPAARAQALDRLLSWYLAGAESAAELLRPAGRPALFGPSGQAASGQTSAGTPAAPRPAGRGPELPRFRTPDQALDWFEAELPTLVALSARAQQPGTAEFCWRLAEAMRQYFIVRRPWSDWVSTYETGLAAAESAGEPLGAARMRDGLGTAYLDLRRFDEAAEVTRTAIDAYRQMGRSDLQALALSNLTGVLVAQGRHREGIDAARQALRIQLEADDPGAAAVTLGNLGMLQIAEGLPRDAVDSYQQGLELSRAAGHRYAEAAIVSNLGEAYVALGCYAEAVEYCRVALDLCAAIGTEHGRAVTLSCLGQALEGTGRTEEARTALAEAVQIFDRLGAPDAEAARSRLADLAPPS